MGGHTTGFWQRGGCFNLRQTCWLHRARGRTPSIGCADTRHSTFLPARRRGSPERSQVRRLRWRTGAVRVAAAPQQPMGQVWRWLAGRPAASHGGGEGSHAHLCVLSLFSPFTPVHCRPYPLACAASEGTGWDEYPLKEHHVQNHHVSPLLNTSLMTLTLTLTP